MINKFKQKLKSKDGKVLLENFLSLSSLKLVGIVMPLLTLPYIFRVIGFDKYGVIVFSASLVAYFNSLIDYSFGVTAVRDVSVFRSSVRKLSVIYSKVMIVKFIFLAISLFTIGLIVYLYPPFHEYKLIYALSSLSLVGSVVFPSWFFQGVEKMKLITLLNLGIRIVFTVSIFVFIKSQDDFWKYPLIQGLGTILGGLVAQYLMFRNFHVRFVLLPIRMIKETIKSNFPIFVNQFFPTLYNNTGTFVLGLLYPSSTVGIYSAILTIIDICKSLLGILSKVFYPFLNRKKDAFTFYRKLMLISSSAMILGCIVFYKLIFMYLDISDPIALPILIILAIGILGFSLYDIFGLNYFIIRRKDKMVMKNTILSSLIGFALCYPFVYFFGAIGAAINLTFSRFLMGGLLYLKWRNEK